MGTLRISKEVESEQFLYLKVSLLQVLEELHREPRWISTEDTGISYSLPRPRETAVRHNNEVSEFYCATRLGKGRL